MPDSKQPSRRSRATRLSARDWVDAGLHALDAGGLDAVAIEPIARTLGATKGSFYWHFADRRALVLAVLDDWLGRSNRIIEDVLAVSSDPRERLGTLFEYVNAPEAMWWVAGENDLLSRLDDPDVARVVAESTRLRLDFVAEALRDLGLSPDAARHGAVQSYALWIGLMHVTLALPSVFDDEADRRGYLDSSVAMLWTIVDGPST